MKIDDPREPETVEELVAHIRELRMKREVRKSQNRPSTRRVPVSVLDRSRIHAKTAGRCHICGGEVGERWQADHVLAHSGGGLHHSDNYLPAHSLCNNYRWDYLPDEFQLILKLGVWARTQIEQQTALGKKMVAAFVSYENARRQRRK